MELVIFDKNKKENIINLEKNVLFFGPNNPFKSELLTTIAEGFIGKNKNLLINGKSIDYKDYNVICMNEETDFANEFKFTKNNLLKQMVYNDIVQKVNEEKIIQYTNEIFDVIDDKVNKLLDRKINKSSENNLSFQIEVPDINSIIDKFTNIYIDNLLLSNDKITKSVKRKVLFQLYFWEIENNKDKTNIIIIDNFDAYLNSNEIIDILHRINKLSSDKCHFILSTSNNIFEYIPFDYFSIYKITNKIISLSRIDDAIKYHIMKNEYYNSNQEKTFDEFYLENESLIIDDDILTIKNKILNQYSYYIGKILNCSSIKLVQTRPKNILYDYIICDNKDMQNLFLEICSQFID